ncbi:MAG: hypothetical protein HeimC2_35490 [Candidatus Heimdallarchaeota archaeon LC_2]|nr:MAG: hypothetical protein HeimC2_35490 [Candidatus Heimdallarchaeota archaeon LC_2]
MNFTSKIKSVKSQVAIIFVLLSIIYLIFNTSLQNGLIGRIVSFIPVIIFIIPSLPTLLEGIENKNWTTTQGSIHVSNLSSTSTRDLMFSGSEIPAIVTFTKYTAYVSYKYTVDGITYYSSRIMSRYGLFNRITGGSISKRSRQNLINKYPKDKKVKTYYDPDDHYNAILEPGIPLGLIFYYFILLLGLFFGINSDNPAQILTFLFGFYIVFIVIFILSYKTF